MNQVPRRTRVRQLAESVWPGRTVNGYANLIGARLRKLAEEGSTGMLPVSGHGDGAVFFRVGQVVYAESSRTPLPVFRASGLAALGLAEGPEPPPGEHAGHGELVTARSVAKLAGTLAVTEAVIDAVTDLLSSDSRYAKFRQSDDPPAQVRPIPVEALLSEVQRRQRVLRQLAVVITPDTEITRQPALDAASAQVSPAQWALLVRAGGGTTPRDLAVHLGRSVFGTTIEVYRLVEVGLLAVSGRQALPPGDPHARRPGPAMSFIRALSGERGNDG
jgi:Domain of unknown function (DUF4388)